MFLLSVLSIPKKYISSPEKCPRLSDRIFRRHYGCPAKIYGYDFLEEVLPESIVTDFRKYFTGFYTAPEESFCTDRATLAQLYLGTEISARERVDTMKLLGSHYHVDLYTGSDTSGLPVQNKGLVKTLTEMPIIFHYSKINLNITAKSIRSGLPLRIFDILGCGGFCLTNYQPELSDYFTIGSDLECYTDEKNLLDKVSYYLSHEKNVHRLHIMVLKQ